MKLGASIAALFGDVNILVVCLWITGMILFVAEFFQPMRGIAYVLGAVLTVSAFIARMTYGSAGEAFAFVLVTAAVIFAVHVVSLATQHRDWLRVSRIEKAGERSRRYGTLIGSIGTANTPIDHTGNVTVGDTNLVVYSEKAIDKGERVRIIRVTPDRIVVEQANYDTEVSDIDE